LQRLKDDAASDLTHANDEAFACPSTRLMSTDLWCWTDEVQRRQTRVMATGTSTTTASSTHLFPRDEIVGGDQVYRFGCVTILEYAGDGQFSYQEDMYNPRDGEKVFGRWLAAGGRLAAAPDALGI
jgi:hypothetical protein